MVYQTLGGVDRRPFGVQIALPQGFPGCFVDGDSFRTRGADIQTEVDPAGLIPGHQGTALDSMNTLDAIAQCGNPLESRGFCRNEQFVKRWNRAWMLHRMRGGANGLQHLVLGPIRDKTHPLVVEPRFDRASNPGRACHAAGQHHVARSQTGTNQRQYVFANSVVKPGKNASATLALVGKMGHVGFEDNRTATRQRGRVSYGVAKLGGFLHRKAKALHELGQKVPGALRTASVLAVPLLAVGPKLQHGKPVRADRNNSHSR